MSITYKKTNFSEPGSKPKRPLFYPAIIKLNDLIIHYIDKKIKDTGFNTFIKNIYGTDKARYPVFIKNINLEDNKYISMDETEKDKIKQEIIKYIKYKKIENYEKNYNIFEEVLKKTFINRYITNEESNKNNIQNSIDILLRNPKGISSSAELNKVLSSLYGSEINTLVSKQALFDFFFYPPPKDAREIQIYTQNKQTKEYYVSETIQSKLWKWTTWGGYKYMECGDRTKYSYIESQDKCVSESEYKLLGLSNQKKSEETYRQTQRNARNKKSDTFFGEQTYFKETENINKTTRNMPSLSGLKQQIEKKIGEIGKNKWCKVEGSNDCQNLVEELEKLRKESGNENKKDSKILIEYIEKRKNDYDTYLKDKKAGKQTVEPPTPLCLCKSHLTFIANLLKKKLGGVKPKRKTQKKQNKKGGNGSRTRTTNTLIEVIKKIDGTESFEYNKPFFININRILNSIINDNFPIDMNYTGDNPNISKEERPLRAILYSYFVEMKKIKNDNDIGRFENAYIRIFTIFLIGFINNQEINNIGYEPVYDFEHSFHTMINLLCKPEYVSLKNSILDSMQDMLKDPKTNDATKEIVQNTLDNPILQELCSPIEPTYATVQNMTKKQKQISNRNLRRYWNSIREKKNQNIPNADPIIEQHTIYGPNGILTLPEAAFSTEGLPLPFTSNDAPDQEQIRRRIEALNNKENQYRSSSTSLPNRRIVDRI